MKRVCPAHKHHLRDLNPPMWKRMRGRALISSSCPSNVKVDRDRSFHTRNLNANDCLRAHNVDITDYARSKMPWNEFAELFIFNDPVFHNFGI